MDINYDRITGFVRAIVPTAVTWLTLHGQGWAGTTWGQIGIIVVVTAGSCIWSWLNNPSGKVIPATITGR